MKKQIYGLMGVITGILTVFGLFYVRELRIKRKVGGRLVRVNYRYSKVFEE